MVDSVQKVRRACAFIETHADQAITLAQLAAHVRASPYHLQRTFTQVVGISPRAYQDALRAGRFRKELRSGTPVAGALYDAGYGSVSRVYERRPTGALTPAAYRRGAAGVAIAYALVDCALGRLLVASTAKGICSVKIGDRDAALEADLRREYPGAELVRDESANSRWVSPLVNHLEGRLPHLDLPIDVRATAFQWKVWRYLRSIPYGETRSYGEVAQAIGAPAAFRAVARACATNRVCLVVPCHRVVQKDGGVGGYRWGVGRKRALLAREATSRKDGGARAKGKGQRVKVKGR